MVQFLAVPFIEEQITDPHPKTKPFQVMSDYVLRAIHRGTLVTPAEIYTALNSYYIFPTLATEPFSKLICSDFRKVHPSVLLFHFYLFAKHLNFSPTHTHSLPCAVNQSCKAGKIRWF